MKNKSQKAVIALIGANAVPLLGVLIFDWSIFSIMIAYWMENIVIGLYNIIKMSKAEAPNPKSIRMNGRPLKGPAKGKLISFFIVHFGGFTLVHGIFVFVLFGLGLPMGAEGSSVIRPDFSILGILLMFIAMLISHGISYQSNFIERGEYKKVSPGEQMFKPYGRVIVMHIVIIGSGFLFGAVGSGRIFACIVIIIKTTLDYYLHNSERLKFFKSGSMSSGDISISR